MSDKAAADELLRTAFVGQEIHHVSCGDQWELRLSNGLWLVAQELMPVPTTAMNISVDPSLVAGSTDLPDAVSGGLLIALMRRRIASAHLESDNSLRFTFEGDFSFVARSDVEVVDWQWFLGSGRLDPYTEPKHITCFFQNQLVLGSV